jgi:hypothetical protein
MTSRISTSLCRVLFKSPEVNDATSLMTVLKADLTDLKELGIPGASATTFCLPQVADLFVIHRPVDRILRQKAEREAAEKAKAEAEPKAAEKAKAEAEPEAVEKAKTEAEPEAAEKAKAEAELEAAKRAKAEVELEAAEKAKAKAERKAAEKEKGEAERKAAEKAKAETGFALLDIPPPSKSPPSPKPGPPRDGITPLSNIGTSL